MSDPLEQSGDVYIYPGLTELHLSDGSVAWPTVASPKPNWELYNVKLLLDGRTKTGDLDVFISASRAGCVFVGYKLIWQYDRTTDFVVSDFSGVIEKPVPSPVPGSVKDVIKGLAVGKKLRIGVYARYEDASHQSVFDPPASTPLTLLVDNIPG